VASELRGDVGVGVRHRQLAGFDAVEQEGGRLPGPDGDARADVAVDDLERAARREAERKLGRAEERAVRGERGLVAGAGVVEARGDVDDEAHLPAHGEYPADHAVAMGRLAGTRRGHEVLHLPDSVEHQEAGDQDVGVGEVSCLELQPSQSGEMRNRLPWSASRIAAKTLGESKRGQQYQSIVPSVPTSATVWRSPIRPWSAIGR